MKRLVTLSIFILILILSVNSATAINLNTSKPNSTVKLVFIHHSSGGNWLADGNGYLGEHLNSNNYYVTETNYGWNAETNDGLGDHTDTTDWPSWFNDEKMPYVYNNNEHSAYTNTIANPGGENEIIMFKSCFPNSEVGNSIDDEKAIYNSIKTYFAAHPNKFFVLITPPGETDVSSYKLTKKLCNWLVDTDNGWLKGYTANNVLVFDFYAVLSETGSHHMVDGDYIKYVYASNYNGHSPYHNGDDHPNSAGNQKATREFIPLLNHAYNIWKNGIPTLIKMSPTKNATNVARNRVLYLKFSEPIKKGTNCWIELKSSFGKKLSISTSFSGDKLTITHSGLLSAKTKYILYLHTGCITDLADNKLEYLTRTFTTGSW